MTRSFSAHDILDGDRLLASVEPATCAEVDAVLNAEPDGDHGRSGWMWLRLPNGDLMLGCFPQGDTYEVVTQTMIRGRI